MNGRELGEFEKIVATGANTPDDWPSFPPKRVDGFNISERSRVGLPTPKYIYIDQKGYVTPINS